MIIRLTLITTAAIVGSMLIFGTDSGVVRDEAIAETMLGGDGAEAPIETAAAPDEDKKGAFADGAVEVATLDPAPVAAEVEVAKEEALDLTGVLPTSMQIDVAVAEAVAATEEEPITLVAAPAADLTSDPQEAEPRIVYVTGSRVNMRAGPSTQNAVIGRLVRGAEAEVIAEAPNGWMQIRDIATGTEGFMSGDFLSPVNPG
ncbi:MAG: SH3 domain-containing protein [Rhodobacter sp.]|nr:SH3 domain-containing protein [Rhodobacter sp.]